jgi:pyrroline-5-carboxylate reductase
MSAHGRLAILGAGNIGRAMAIGFEKAGVRTARDMILTRRDPGRLDDLAGRGFEVQADNRDAVRRASTVIIAVTPQDANGVLAGIAADLAADRHLLISVVSGASIADIRREVGNEVPVVRAMPNTAIALGQSMTCLAGEPDRPEAVTRAAAIFDAVGRAIVIGEDLMVPATALCACGVAFFLRAVRAASQGGIEIGFHPAEALVMAAQTALGAAALALQEGGHPERAIDSVTTPRGCTIAGLNEMEHQGFSSSLIRGIVTSAVKAGALYARR